MLNAGPLKPRAPRPWPSWPEPKSGPGFTCLSSSYRAKPGCFHRRWPQHEDAWNPGCRSVLRCPTSSAADPSVTGAVDAARADQGAIVLYRLDYANSVLAGLPAHLTRRLQSVLMQCCCPFEVRTTAIRPHPTCFPVKLLRLPCIMSTVYNCH
jgi:hypothetical protein